MKDFNFDMEALGWEINFKDGYYEKVYKGEYSEYFGGYIQSVRILPVPLEDNKFFLEVYLSEHFMERGEGSPLDVIRIPMERVLGLNNLQKHYSDFDISFMKDLKKLDSEYNV